MTTLFTEPLKIVNVGLRSFSDSIAAAGGQVLELDWQPPANGQIETGRALARMIVDSRVEEANKFALQTMLAVDPVLKDILPAKELIPELSKRKMLLHAGPPVMWEKMCGPMRGAIVGAVLLERWAATAEEAERLASCGDIEFAPCHHFGAVGPMAGVISPSMPLWVVADANGEGCAYSSLNEGLGKVLRFGAHDSGVLDRLRWMKDVLAPILREVLHTSGSIVLKPLMAQSLHMGDELHNRNSAATSLLFKRLMVDLLKCSHSDAHKVEVANFIALNDHFFLNISMAACKVMLDAAHGIAHCSLVTAMARNGMEFGIRVSGTGSTWFTAPAPTVRGLFFAGFGEQDASPDLGDSAITETAGFGAFSLAAAPAIAQFVGGSAEDAVSTTLRMRRIAFGVNPAFTIPFLAFSGTPFGIDVRRVVDRSIVPIMDTGIAHREAGVGQIGAGLSNAPIECFIAALDELGRKLGNSPPPSGKQS